MTNYGSLFRPALLTVVAMLAFAANSVLCRLALGGGAIDAASFTSIRIIAGAIILILLTARGSIPISWQPPAWQSVVSLFLYMVFFSFAYLTLAAGTGALVLFGAVQLTMFIVAMRQGELFSLTSWFGLALAIAGLIYLVSPGVTAPDPIGAALMTIAGVAWGVYSLLGRGVKNPLQATMSNFIYTLPLAIIITLVFMNDINTSQYGIALAVMSGAIASGCGYTIWYAALPRLTASSAATVQLTVPAIAAIGGVIFLSEDITPRLIVASIATLGGVALVLTQRTKKPAS